ncbi:MAG: hypothetical protein V9G19_09815 [Tetrasphaera sp.]
MRLRELVLGTPEPQLLEVRLAEVGHDERIAVEWSENPRLPSDAIGQEFVIDVDLPHDAEAPPPVVLVLDGTTTFPLVSSTVRFLRMYHDISPVAVVGVGYPDVVDMVSSMPERTRDLTPSDGREWWHGHFLGHPRRPALCRLPAAPMG